VNVNILTDYSGRSVRPTDERIQHILAHPEMAGMESWIAETVKHPDLVVQSRTDHSVHLCHRFQETEKFGDKWLCVVIKYKPDDAFIITAYLTDKIKTGTVIWHKPQ